MQDTLPPLDTTFFQTVEARKIALSAALRSYFANVMGIQPTFTALRNLRMEEVFRDAFYDFQETPADRGALNAYIDLIELYLRVLRETTNWLGDDGRTGAPVGRFLAAASDYAEELTVITFNHDLVIENEITRRERLRSRWCLDAGYGTIGENLHLTRPTASYPVFHLHTEGLCDHSRPITVLKLHGSLNWVARINSDRPTAGFLSGQTGNRDIYLIVKRALLAREPIVRTGQGRTRWMTWPIVVPPVYAKQALRAAVQDVWQDARAALEAADTVAVFGYSLPEIDIEAEKLIERSLAKSNASRIHVINPAPASAQRFAGLGPALPVRWYPSMTRFLAEGAFENA
jgi:hypothetical protein